MKKWGNIAIIANFVFSYIYFLFFFNLQHMMLANVKLDISGCNALHLKVTDFIGPVLF